LKERIKRLEFNMVEAKVMKELILKAKRRSEEARAQTRKIRSKVGKLLPRLLEEGYIMTVKELERVKLNYKVGVGIDGSYQLVGGAGGIWYAPMSAVLILALYDDNGKLLTGIEEMIADIKKIDESEYPHPRQKASELMLENESKLIKMWGKRRHPSYVFIDGPIVDPPNPMDPDRYIPYRAEAIKTCLDHSTVIGCVKRSRDRAFVKLISNKFTNLGESINDQIFLSHLFTYLRLEKEFRSYKGPLFTRWIDISDYDKTYRRYMDEGIHVMTLFYQHSFQTPILRIDVPITEDPQDMESEKLEKYILEAVKAVYEWSKPGLEYPLP